MDKYLDTLRVTYKTATVINVPIHHLLLEETK